MTDDSALAHSRIFYYRLCSVRNIYSACLNLSHHIKQIYDEREIKVMENLHQDHVIAKNEHAVIIHGAGSGLLQHGRNYLYKNS